MYDRRPKDSKGGKATMEVNGVEWSVDSARKERPCASCGMLTKGRIGRKPMCLGDGMKELMKPIGDFRDRLEALLGTNGALFK
jgi:hypothetical protein